MLLIFIYTTKPSPFSSLMHILCIQIPPHPLGKSAFITSSSHNVVIIFLSESPNYSVHVADAPSHYVIN